MLTSVRATSRWRNPRSFQLSLGKSRRVVSGAYFQVALSQVISELSLVIRCSSVTSRLRNRKSRCPRSSVCSSYVRTAQWFRNRVTSRWRNPRSLLCSLCLSCVSDPGTRVTSRWRNPRSSVLSPHLDQRSRSVGNGLLPGRGIPGHLGSPLIRSLLPGCRLERNRVPGHGGKFLSGGRWKTI
jgi:hypothetical protein